MSGIGLVLDERFETHDTGPGHPERPERLRRIRSALAAAGLEGRCRRVVPAEAPDEWITRVHTPAHLRDVERRCAGGAAVLDGGDTRVCAESARVARLAAGAVVTLCAEVARGELRGGFAAVRPPGHHAERDGAMGFCLFNNVAVAAAHLRAAEGMRRVLVVDWDVHHGNGTQHIFEEDPDVFYFSVHQSPLYPGTGAAEERGRGTGQGATRNSPLAPGTGDDGFLRALERGLVPAADEFRPEFILVSAGFDAHRADPLAQLEVSAEGFRKATRIVLDLAGRHACGRVVSVLEGGYDLEALAESVVAHVDELLD